MNKVTNANDKLLNLCAILKNSREWHAKAQEKPLHSAILRAWNIANPIDWHDLILQYPTVSEDGQRIAYYQNEVKAKRDIKTVTSIGKYLTRHFPSIEPHILRDIASIYTAKVEIITDMESMLDCIINGPYSCMKNHDREAHPYRVYSPEYGWAMAVRKTNDGEIIARALINGTCFVRCYADGKNSDSYANGADNNLEAWLNANGYDKLSGWKVGTKIAKIKCGYNLIGPYIDGCVDNADDMGEYLRLCRDGEYELNNTDGTIGENNSATCDCCGCRVHEDDSVYLGEYGDGTVCEDCANTHYTYISETKINGRYRGGFYLPNDEVGETVEGDAFPINDASDWDIVELHDGTYTQLDNAVYCEDDEAYYHIERDCDKFAYCEDDSEYHSEFWKCAHSDKFYSCEQAFAYNDEGQKIHPDYADEYNALCADSCED